MLEEGTEHELLLFPSVRRLYCFLDSHLSPIVCVDLKEVVVVFMVPGACCLSLLQYETEERGMRWKSVRHIFHCFAKWYNKFSHNFHCEDMQLFRALFYIMLHQKRRYTGNDFTPTETVWSDPAGHTQHYTSPFISDAPNQCRLFKAV